MKKIKLSQDLFAHPSVFAVENEYQIIIPTKSEVLIWIEISGESFYDHSNGVLRSSSPIHKITVPMKLLDAAKEYTLCYRKVIKRKSYFTETEDVKRIVYPFRPVEKGRSINIFHVADSHSRVEAAVAAAKANEYKTDLLILNGDVAEDSDTVEKIIGIYEIASGITGGTVPCVYSRGNHDLRGLCAEKLPGYTPNRYGKTYYTFRLGDLWGMVLDCGEDKNDDHEEYGNTLCCHSFRREETRFIEDVIEKKEFADDSIKYKMIVCHIPFTWANKREDIFDIESKLYSKWCRLLDDNIHPDLILCGHVHKCDVIMPGDSMDSRGQPCPVILGTRPRTFEGEDGFTGTELILSDGTIDIKFTDNIGNEETACPKIQC